MKFKALAIGLLFSSPFLGNAHAASSVTLYGSIDTGIEHVNNIAQRDGSTKSSTHFTNITSSWPSYWGLRGTEQLDNNLSVLFTLESGFNPGTGTHQQGGRLFGRQAWVGLKGDWGQIALGRQYNMLLIASMQADLQGPHAHGLGALDNYIPNSRMDNSITYRGNFDGFKFGAAYARGRDTVTSGGPSARGCGVQWDDQSACSAWSTMLGYDSATWGVAAAYDVIRGGDTTWGNGGLTDGSDKDRRWTANGYIKFNDLKVTMLYINRKNEGGIRANNYAWTGPLGTPLGDRSDLWALGAVYNVTPAVTLQGTVYYLDYKDSDDNARSLYYVAQAKYAFSKRTSTYISAGFMNNRGSANNSAAGGTVGATPHAGDNQTSIMVGLRHGF